jgi:hypothetical protein
VWGRIPAYLYTKGSPESNLEIPPRVSLYLTEFYPIVSTNFISSFSFHLDSCLHNEGQDNHSSSDSASGSGSRLSEPPRVSPPSKSPPKWKLLSAAGTGAGVASRFSVSGELVMAERVLRASGPASASRLSEPPRVRPPEKSPPKWKLLSAVGAGAGVASRFSFSGSGEMAMCSRVLCASGSASATRLDEPPRVRPPSKSPPKWKLLSGLGDALASRL